MRLLYIRKLLLEVTDRQQVITALTWFSTVPHGKRHDIVLKHVITDFSRTFFHNKPLAYLTQTKKYVPINPLKSKDKNKDNNTNHNNKIEQSPSEIVSRSAGEKHSRLLWNKEGASSTTVTQQKTYSTSQADCANATSQL
jgi:hypothetical protein